MRIKRIELNNFRMFDHFEAEFDGKDSVILGDNETGKTTIANAYSWLLTGKAYTGEVGFNPKTIEGEAYKHNTNHSAEFIFVTPDDKELSLKKDYHEVWTRKRGEQAEELTGNTTDHFVDGVPLSEKEYQNVVQMYFGNTETILMLIDPLYFSSSLSWQKRREIMMPLFEGVSDSDVISSDPVLEPLRSEMFTEKRTFTVEEVKKVAEAKRKKANEHLKTLPARLDESNRYLFTPPVGVTIESLTAHNSELAESIKEKEAQIKQLESMTIDEALERREQDIARFRYRIQTNNEIKQQLKDKEDRKRRKAVDDAQSDVDDAKIKMQSIQQEIRVLENQMEEKIASRERAKVKRQELAEKVFDGETICVHCGQPLPEDKIKHAKEDFNRYKSRNLELIDSEAIAKYSISIIEEIREKIESKQFDLAKITEVHEQAIQSLEKAKEPSVVDEDGYLQEAAKLDKENSDLEAEIEKLKAIEPDQRPIEIEEQIGNIKVAKSIDEKMIEENNTLILKIKASDSVKKRIETLVEEEKTAGRSLTEAEVLIDCCDMFSRVKANLVSDIINSQFKRVRFRLFVEQINGGIKDDFEVLIPSKGGDLIPFTSANFAGRINAGLEIINKLASEWNIDIPIVIDGAESVTSYLPTESQLIRLVVDEAEKELKTIVL